MKNHALKIATYLLLTAVAFLIYPVTFEFGGRNDSISAQNVIVDYEADETQAMSGFMLL